MSSARSDWSGLFARSFPCRRDRPPTTAISYFYFGSFFSREGLRAWLGDDGGSSARASPVLSGGSTPSVARVLVQTALPRESCSTLPLGPSCCRLKSGRRIFTVSTMPNAPAERYSLFKPKTQILDCPPTWSQNAHWATPETLRGGNGVRVPCAASSHLPHEACRSTHS